MRKYATNIVSTWLVLIVCFAVSGSVSHEIWWEETGKTYGYHLGGYRFLIVVGDDFDHHEMARIKKYWEDWGANVDIAGMERKVMGHILKKTGTGWDTSEKITVKTDVLISQLDLTKYNAIFFPGGKSPENLIAEDSLRVVRLIQNADRDGLVLSAICHGPHALAAAGILKNRKATGHPDVIKGIQESGGEYVMEVYVSDGNIVTGNWPYFETFAVKVAEKLLYPKGGAPRRTSPFDTNLVLKTIKERRSVRAFQDKDVDSTSVKLLLEAASWAPSANNDQPWKFVVVRSRETKDRIHETLMARMKDYYTKQGYPEEAVRRYWSSIFSSPVHIFAFCDTTGIDISEEWEQADIMHQIQGVTVACQNILLAATALDLGSLWVGALLVIEDEIKALLLVPEELMLVTVIAIGYPAYKPLPPVRRPISDVTFFESWMGK